MQTILKIFTEFVIMCFSLCFVLFWLATRLVGSSPVAPIQNRICTLYGKAKSQPLNCQDYMQHFHVE